MQAPCFIWNWHWACNVYNIWMKGLRATAAPAALLRSNENKNNYCVA